MLYTTLSFLVFFALVYVLFWSLRGRVRLYLLLVVSIAFYAFWSWKFALHFIAIVLINYYFIERLLTNRSRSLLAALLGINLVNLVFFKYSYFGWQALTDVFAVLYEYTDFRIFDFLARLNIGARRGFDALLERSFGVTFIVLPLAISFYTFQLSAYAVDVYRGKITRSSPLPEFLVFILFFPQLVAGPIMRRDDFYPQLERIHELTPEVERTQRGMFLLCLGLIKKVVIADNLIRYTEPYFNRPDPWDGPGLFLAVLGFAARLYCDFSGYTDMARGLANLLGMELPRNFQGPYLSTSLSETWRRWHMTLSNWLRDYVYISLGGSRTAPWRTNLNLVLTFMFIGLWHGASYNFLVFGILHGLILLVERAFGLDKPFAGTSFLRLYFVRPARIFVTFMLWTILLVIFETPDMGRAWTMLSKILTFADGTVYPHGAAILGFTAVTLFLNALQVRSGPPTLSSRTTWFLLWIFGCVTIILLGRFAGGGGDFYYFRF